ncbi:unnamed protein product, partial [Rotaria socialis]
MYLGEIFGIDPYGFLYRMIMICPAQLGQVNHTLYYNPYLVLRSKNDVDDSRPPYCSNRASAIASLTRLT